MAADYSKILLDESEMPTQWYNVIPDLPTPPPPPLHPGTHEPIGPDDLAPLFPMALIMQEVSTDSFIDIPGGVLDVYKLWRPSRCFGATPRGAARYPCPHLLQVRRRESGRLPQAQHLRAAGLLQPSRGHHEAHHRDRRRSVGQLPAFATAQYGIECEVWQVAASYRAKPYRKTMMEIWGATVHPSPSDKTEFGRELLAADPDHPGSLGIAISEAVAMAVEDPKTRYALGSVLNHVLLHQTIIGQEALMQLEMAGDTPTLIVGCTGGGSNFAGLSFPFIKEKLDGKMSPRILAAEPASCPSLTRGIYAYDFGDTAGMTPLMKMHTLGHDFIPDPIHAGGLRYHGMAPLISHLHEEGLMDAESVPQTECFAAAVQFARTEGIVPAPEPTHAIALAIREALKAKETGEETVILTALCGHGHFDLAAYENYLAGAMVDEDVSDERFAAALETLPEVQLS